MRKGLGGTDDPTYSHPKALSQTMKNFETQEASFEQAKTGPWANAEERPASPPASAWVTVSGGKGESVRGEGGKDRGELRVGQGTAGRQAQLSVFLEPTLCGTSSC